MFAIRMYFFEMCVALSRRTECPIAFNASVWPFASMRPQMDIVRASIGILLITMCALDFLATDMQSFHMLVQQFVSGEQFVALRTVHWSAGAGISGGASIGLRRCVCLVRYVCVIVFGAGRDMTLFDLLMYGPLMLGHRSTTVEQFTARSALITRYFTIAWLGHSNYRRFYWYLVCRGHCIVIVHFCVDIILPFVELIYFQP